MSEVTTLSAVPQALPKRRVFRSHRNEFVGNEGRGSGGLVVRAATFFSESLSSNPTDVCKNTLLEQN